jgi:hypothetical protein
VRREMDGGCESGIECVKSRVSSTPKFEANARDFEHLAIDCHAYVTARASRCHGEMRLRCEGQGGGRRAKGGGRRAEGGGR